MTTLSCPFCGHRATGPGFNAEMWWISCTHCEAEMGHGIKDRVVAMWNSRAVPNALLAAIADSWSAQADSSTVVASDEARRAIRACAETIRQAAKEPSNG